MIQDDGYSHHAKHVSLSSLETISEEDSIRAPLLDSISDLNDDLMRLNTLYPPLDSLQGNNIRPSPATDDGGYESSKELGVVLTTLQQSIEENKHLYKELSAALTTIHRHIIANNSEASIYKPQRPSLLRASTMRRALSIVRNQVVDAKESIQMGMSTRIRMWKQRGSRSGGDERGWLLDVDPEPRFFHWRARKL